MLGTYEMTGFSGTMYYGDEAISLETNPYEYFRVTLEKDGVMNVQSKEIGGTAYEANGTWSLEGDAVKFEIKTQSEQTPPVKVLEKMEWKDGVLTCTMTQNEDSRFTISMTVSLEKVKD